MKTTGTAPISSNGTTSALALALGTSDYGSMIQFINTGTQSGYCAVVGRGEAPDADEWHYLPPAGGTSSGDAPGLCTFPFFNGVTPGMVDCYIKGAASMAGVHVRAT